WSRARWPLAGAAARCRDWGLTSNRRGGRGRQQTASLPGTGWPKRLRGVEGRQDGTGASTVASTSPDTVADVPGRLKDNGVFVRGYLITAQHSRIVCHSKYSAKPRCVVQRIGRRRTQDVRRFDQAGSRDLRRIRRQLLPDHEPAGQHMVVLVLH